MQTEIYKLDEITFIGGSTETFKFNLKTSTGTDAFDASDTNVNFAITKFGNQNGTPIISKDATLEMDENDIFSIAVVELEPSDTLDLFGRFVYQIIIKDSGGAAEIPYQGIINIISNINKSYLVDVIV